MLLFVVKLWGSCLRTVPARNEIIEVSLLVIRHQWNIFLYVLPVTRFHIIVAWLLPPKIVTTTLSTATVPQRTREPGGLKPASIQA